MPPDSSRDKLAEALGDQADHVVMERGYSLAFVGVHGQVRLIQFRLSKKGFSTDKGADELAFAHLLDEFAAMLDGLLRERFGGIALRAAFDAEGELIARLYEQGTLERCDEVDPASTAGRLVKDGESVDARELLIRASARLVENWGVFEQAPRLDDGALAYEAKCRRLVTGAVG